MQPSSATIAPIAALVRKAAAPAVLAKGAALAREGAVLAERVEPDELTLRVRAPGFDAPPTVVLYVAEREWACDCGGHADPCPHVVAAVLALADGGGPRVAPVARAAPARVRYLLEVERGLLVVSRAVVAPGGDATPLGGASLAAAASAAGLLPDEADLAVERVLEAFARDAADPARLAAVLDALAERPDVRLAGVAVRTGSEPLAPRAVVERTRDGEWVLRVGPDPGLTDVVAPGLGRAGDVLRPLAATAVTGPRLERLPFERRFAAADVDALVLEALPTLAAAGVPAEVRGGALPAPRRGVRPRVVFAFDHAEHTLSARPALAYGDPPVARIEGGRMVHLGGDVLPVRDPAAERALLARLRDELDLAPGRVVHYDRDDAVRFAARVRAWAAATGDAPGIERVLARPVAPRIDARDDGFELWFESPGDEAEASEGKGARRADAAAVLRAWRDGLDLVPLEGGGWAPLPSDWLAEHGHRVADLLAARREDGSVARAATPLLVEVCDALEHPRPPSLARLASLLADAAGVPDAELPSDLTAALRPYQRRGVDWLCFLRDAGLGAVLADDMGLGKTLQVLCALRGRALVVCPRSVVHNWAAEIRRFRPGLRCALYHGPGRRLDPSADVTLTTYALLRLDAAALAAERWDAVVLDEAQNVKNPDAQAARAAYGLAAGFRVALSGTPVENRLEELWSLLHFTNPGLLGGRHDFEARYAAPVADGDARALDQLRARIRPVVLRRRKRDVLPELPPRTDAVLHVELDERERSVYDAVRVATRAEVARRLGAGEGGALAALEALLRLRQAACHPALVPGQQAETSSKVERLCEALGEAAADGHKALVFSQWTGLLDLVEPHLRAADVPFARLDGATRDRGGVVAEFQSPGGPPVMLVSLKAGGTGLNLTAADHVFLLDPWWNPAAEDQAADRAHRIGQDRPVLVYRLVAKDTVEERILALQARKRAIADATLESGAAAAAGAAITREELLALLE